METVIHILGICPDSVSHLDLRDLLAILHPETNSAILKGLIARLKLFLLPG